MYARLTGTIVDIFPDFIILDVSGVGYKVETIEDSYLIDQQLSIYVYTHVRENEIRLFGLNSKIQYQLFVDLINISGVGPKLAQNILKQITYENLLNAIADKDIDTILVKGVGKKTAQRIIIDMFSKLENYNWNTSNKMVSFSDEFKNSSKLALQNLGFSSNEIKSILKDYSSNEGEEKLESLVKFALKFINKT